MSYTLYLNLYRHISPTLAERHDDLKPCILSLGAGEWSLVEGDQQQLTLRFPRALEEGAARVSIGFSYPLREGLSGFYRSSFSSAPSSRPSHKSVSSLLCLAVELPRHDLVGGEVARDLKPCPNATSGLSRGPHAGIEQP